MVKRTFPKEDLLDLLDCSENEGFDGYTLITNEMVDTSRWSIHYNLIFKFEDKFYQAPYSVGATESQDEGPWEYEGDEAPIDCYEVEPVEKTVIVYKRVK